MFGRVLEIQSRIDCRQNDRLRSKYELMQELDVSGRLIAGMFIIRRDWP